MQVAGSKATMAAIGRSATMQLAGNALAAAGALATTVVVSRRLGYDDLSLFALGFGFVSFASLLSRLGLDLAAAYFPSHHHDRGDDALASASARACLRAALLLGTVAAALTWLVAPAAAAALGDPGFLLVLRTFALSIPAFNVLHVGAGALRAARRPWQFIAPRLIVFPLCQFGFVFLALWWRHDPVAAAASTFVAAMVAAGLTIAFFARAFPATDATVPLGPMLTFGGWNASSQNLQLIVVWVDLLILGLFHPAELVGLYRVASQGAQLLVLVALAFDSLYVPSAARLISRGDHAHLVSATRATTRMVFYFTGGIATLFALAPELILLPFGPHVAPAYGPFIILTVAFAVSHTLGPAAYIIILGGRSSQEAFLNAAAAVAAVSLGFLLVPTFGALGAAVATAGAVAVRFLLRLPPLLGMGYDPFQRSMARGAVGFAAVLAAGALIGHVAPELRPWSGVLLAPAFLVWGLWGILTRDDRIALVRGVGGFFGGARSSEAS